MMHQNAKKKKNNNNNSNNNNNNNNNKNNLTCGLQTFQCPTVGPIQFLPPFFGLQIGVLNLCLINYFLS